MISLITKIFSAQLNEQLPDGTYLRGIVFYNENGVVLTSEDNHSPKPFKFYLAQNYPNPFNAKTKIIFSIPDANVFDKENMSSSKFEASNSKQVILKVYDLLGREVATLIDENKNPGFFEVTFNAGNLPSGIYLYSLRTGSHILTKKMILIK